MRLKVKEAVIFGMLGAVMFASKIIMDAFPNIHLIGVFVVAVTVVYRKKALYPIYIFVMLTGLYGGFGTWWIPYLYIWTVLWGAVMLIPKNLPTKAKTIVYMIVCSLHGFLFGLLYAPVQALLFNLSFEGTIAWIIAGLPFDITHGISNLIGGILIVPIISILKLAEKASHRT